MRETNEQKKKKKKKKHRIQEIKDPIEKRGKENSENGVERKVQDADCVAGLENTSQNGMGG